MIHLPADCLFKIFSYLNAKELCEAAQVCKIWHKICSSDLIWRQIPLRDTPISAPFKQNWIRLSLLFLEKEKEIAQLKLPTYQQEFVPATVCDEEEWIRAFHELKTEDLSERLLPMQSSKEVKLLLKTVAKVFHVLIALSKHGFAKKLTKAESLALLTKNTFLNPYPFEVLKAEYDQQKNLGKSFEMQLFAEETRQKRSSFSPPGCI